MKPSRRWNTVSRTVDVLTAIWDHASRRCYVRGRGGCTGGRDAGCKLRSCAPRCDARPCGDTKGAVAPSILHSKAAKAAMLLHRTNCRQNPTLHARAKKEARPGFPYPSSQAIPLSAQANIICDRKRLNAYRPDGFVASGVTSVIVPKKPIIISSQV
jgi:hypothetical protein